MMVEKAGLEQLSHSDLVSNNIRLFIKRIDNIHPYISGNKWFKLKYNFQEAKQLQRSTIITFGGAFSNHILAVAAKGYEENIATIGIIRGEKVLPLNPTLNKAVNLFGMNIYYLGRKEYRQLTDRDKLSFLGVVHKNAFIIPEGGTNSLAVKGCEEILDENDLKADYICTSCGTGGTLAGLIGSAFEKNLLIGFSALKGDFLKKEVAELVNSYASRNLAQWQINTEFHFGGYAKHTLDLIDFINTFKKQHGIALDPIYTGKMMFGVFSLINNHFFRKNSTIICLHTGGIQGIEGFNQQNGNLIS